MNSAQILRSYEGRQLALDYLKYRPRYSNDVAETILKWLRSHHDEQLENGRFKRMLDIGCGNGMVTEVFRPYFDSILGIDVSSSMIDVAREINKSDNISYQLVHDNNFPADENSIDFINCATAAHWLDIKKFEAECDRVLKPGGGAALYTYLENSVQVLNSGEVFDLGHEFTAAIEQFLIAIKAHPRNRIIAQKYRPIFEQLSSDTKKWIPGLTFMKLDTLESFLGYFGTIGEYHAQEYSGKDPLVAFEENVRRILRLGEETSSDIHLRVKYDVPLIAFHKKKY